MEKTCSKCSQTFPEEDFYWQNRTKGKRHPYCKWCMQTYHKNHYLNNKQAYKDSVILRREKARQFLQDLKERTPCADCGVSYPYWVMDFDHLHDKEFLLSQNRGSYNDVKVKAEIEKCDIVCSNCHRQRSQERKAWL